MGGAAVDTDRLAIMTNAPKIHRQLTHKVKSMKLVDDTKYPQTVKRARGPTHARQSAHA